jgi:plasmid stabilization system protein ParE
MADHVIFTRAADAEIAEAYDWCEEREPGLGDSFLRYIDACVLTIQRNPQMFPIAVKHFRRAPVRRFPFEIFYEPGEHSITIHSVFHSSQDRKYGGHGWARTKKDRRCCYPSR